MNEELAILLVDALNEIRVELKRIRLELERLTNVTRSKS